MNPSAHELCLRLGQLQARFQHRLDDALGTSHGIGHADFLLLHALADAGDAGLELRPLATTIGLTPSALFRRLAPLEKIGLVERLSGRVSLRPGAHALLTRARETVDDWCGDVVRVLDAGALSSLVHDLETLAASPRWLA
jgi:DNA-binding MarR family transcriptional regulator